MSGDPHAMTPGSTPGAVDEPELVSYAQNAEDIRLLKALRDVTDGFWVDVGAAHPTNGNTTRLFSERGWTGINIEPGPLFDELAAERTRDVNLEVVVGRTEGERALTVTYPDIGLSTVRPDALSRLGTEHVATTHVLTRPQHTLARVLDEHATGRAIHFLKVDVEGAEEEVLASADWTRHRPWIVVVEAVEAWSDTPTHAQWEERLTGSGYEFAVFDGLNRFYVADEHRERAAALASPVSPVDRFVTWEVRDLRDRTARAEQEATRLEGIAHEAIAARRARVHASLPQFVAALDASLRREEAVRDNLAAALAAHDGALENLDRHAAIVEAMSASRAWRMATAARRVVHPLRGR